MAYMCQGCSAEGESWPGECPHCHSKLFLTIADKKPDLVGTVINGRYKVVERLGQGGMGTVFKAVREEMGQTLAIKMLNPEFSNEPEVVKRFLREAKSYGAVQHPNAVNLLDFGQTEQGALYIAMEYIAGRDLGRTIGERGRLAIPDALDITVQCCDVLGYAHEKGIIHRDLKPENIMLVRGLRSYHAKVLDFGIARLMSDNATQLTVQGTICGTPRYMSPEQARGKEIDNRSDVYALGLVLFEMLTGRQVFTYTSITDLLRAQVMEPVPHLWEVEGGKDLPEQLDHVVQRACAKDRDQRYVSMGAFADALSKALPTLTEMRPYTGSHESVPHPSSDPAAPGRTYLGPGAANAVAPPHLGQANTIPPSHASLQPMSNEPVDAALLANRMTPAPLQDPTLLKPQRVPSSTEARAPHDPLLPLADERPGRPATAPTKSKAGLFAALGGVAVLGLAAAIVVPRLGARPEALQPVPSPPPVATPLPAKVPEPAPQPAAAPPQQPAPAQPVPQAPAPTLAPKPAVVEHPVQAPPVRSGRVHHPSGSAVATAVGAIEEQAALASYQSALREFASGNLGGVRVALDQIKPTTHVARDAEALRKKLSDAERYLGEGVAADRTGDCPRATAAYKKALELSPGLAKASAGIARCARASAPATMDSP